MNHLLCTALLMLAATATTPTDHRKRSGPIAEVLRGWRANRALVKSGRGWVLVDMERRRRRSPGAARLDGPLRKSATAVRFLFQAGRARWEVYPVPFQAERKRDAPLPPLGDKGPRSLYIDYEEGTLARHQHNPSLVLIHRPGTGASLGSSGTVPLDHLMYGKLETLLSERRGGSVAAFEETIDGARLIRVDATRFHAKGRYRDRPERFSVWADPARGYALVRREWAWGGYRGLHRHRLERLKNGAWFPVVTEEEYCQPDDSDRPRLYHKIRFTFRPGFEFNVPIKERLFTLPSIIKPGGRIVDHRVRPPSALEYHPPEEQAALREYVREIVKTRGPAPGSRPGRPSF